MRVGVISHTTAGRGGIEQVVAAQVAGLRARGHEVRVTHGPELGAGPAARAVAAAGLAMQRGSGLRSCDVLVAHYPPAPQVAARSGRPYLHYLHHPLRMAYPTSTQRRGARTGARLWWAAGSTLRGIDHRGVLDASVVAVPGPAVAAEVRRLYGVDAEVLPLGIDTTAFTPDPAWSEGGDLLFVGRPDQPYKRIDWAIEVARRLGRRLEVVGDARRRPPTDGVDVAWTGFLSGEALVAAYRRSSVLLFPSVHEDFGLVPLEALACGVPVVAWDDGHGPSYTLARCPQAALVPAYDLDAFTVEVERMLQGARASGTGGPEFVRQRFSAEAHVARLDGLLRAVAEGAA